MNLPRRSGPRVAFVLSGGASLGAVQVGMLRALVERDIRPDVIVGTSVGAVNGAFLASRDFTADTVDELAELWRGVRRGHVFPLEPLTGLLGFLGARRNLVPAGALRRLVSRHVSFDRLEELPTPLHVVACDLLAGEELLISEGPLVDAVLVSAAIPGVLPPVEWQGRVLVDGGVLNNTPLTHALELGAREVYVLPTGSPCALAEVPHGAIGMVVLPPSIQRSNAKHYKSDTVTEVKEFEGPHLLPAAPGWEQVADYALDWALRHARQSSPA